jgi:tetratricopeptide (TPR) repeat protein
MKNKTSTRKRVMTVVATVIVGAIIFAFGITQRHWFDAQYVYLDNGNAAYQTDDLQSAIKFYDQSLGVYKSRMRSETWSDRFLYPKPDRRVAAEAAFHKGMALLKAKQAEAAVKAFQESLQLNPGNMYEGTLNSKDQEAAREEAGVVKYNLMLLFKSQPQLAQGQGKGKGQGKPGDKPGDGKPVPSDDPSSKPGKGDKDAI